MTSQITLPPERRPISLQAMIGISVGAGIVLCFLALAIALGALAKREVLKLSQISIDNLAQQMARELSSGMDGFVREITYQASRERFQTPTPVEQMRVALDEIKSARPDFSWIGVVDGVSAEVLASTGGIFEHGDTHGRPVFESGRAGPFVGDLHSAVKLAALLPKLADGEPQRFLDVAAPIKNAQGQTIRVFTAHINWEWTNRVREELLGPAADRRNVEIMLVNSDGSLVLAPNHSVALGSAIETLAPNALSARGGPLRWADGQTYLTASVAATAQGRFPGLGWKVIVRQPVASAVGPAERLRDGFFIGALVLGLGTAAIAWLAAGWVIRPVRQLMQDAMQTSLQEDAPMPAKSRIGEIAQMQTALSRLTSEGRAHSRTSTAREQQFAAFADSLPDVVWQADTDGRIDYANAHWLQLFGPFDGVVLANLAAIAHPADLPTLHHEWERCRQTGNDFSVSARLALLPLHAFEWFRLRGCAVRDSSGEIFGWVGTFSNINDSVLHNQQAEQERDAERKARSEAERALRMKDDFLATLSHELRTPLNAISGWAQVLVRRPDVDPFVSRAAGVISRNVHLQAKMIGDLLDMSAVISGEVVLQMRAIDGGALVAETVEAHQTIAVDKPMLLTKTVPRAPSMIMADPQRLQQVLENLLSNALKFTEPGGKIHVSALSVDQHLVIRVSDNGSGIASEFLPHVFDRFQQEDGSSTRRRGGLGLGLALARSLVELHHGTICAVSEGPGRGSEIVVTLPLLRGDDDSTAKSVDIATGMAQSASLDGMRILLTDDEADARDAVQALLTSLGAHVATAASAEQAFAALASQEFDLLLCDIAMPVTDGYTLIRRLRAGPYAALPAIALSAFAMPQDQLRAREAGFDAHIAKPVSADKLVEAIRALI